MQTQGPGISSSESGSRPQTVSSYDIPLPPTTPRNPLTIFPHKNYRGVEKMNGLSPERHDGEPLSFVNVAKDGGIALRERYTSDAYLVCYSTKSEAQFRLRKECLADLIQIGEEPQLYWLAVDLDNKDHAEWEGDLDAHMDALEEKLSQDPITRKAGIYLTKRGARAMFPLTSPLPASRAEPYIRGLIRHFKELGLHPDPACSDWTRFYRVPRGTRNGVKQNYPIGGQWAFLNPNEIKPENVPAPRKKKQHGPSSPQHRDTERLIDKCLAVIPAKGNEAWELVAKALHHWDSSEAGWEKLDTWSKEEVSEYDPAANRKRWDSWGSEHHPNPTTVGSLLKYAQEQHGLELFPSWEDVWGKSTTSSAIDYGPGNDWSEAGLALRCVEIVEEQAGKVPSVYDRGALWVYRDMEGLYREVVEDESCPLIMGWHGQWNGKKMLKISRNLLTNVQHLMGKHRLKTGFFDDRAPGIVFRNGRWFEGVLYPHSPEYRFRHALPVEYDPDAECPWWQTTLDQILPDKGLQDILQEMFGNVLARNTTRYEKAFMLFGKGANGKSLVCKVLKGLLDPRTVRSIPPHEFQRRFRTEGLEEAWLNLVTEVEKSELKHTETFKAVISGELIEAERKHQSAFKFMPRVACVFACNGLPVVTDPTHGWWRKIVVLPFLWEIPESEQIKELHEKLLDAEAAGIANWALAGYERCLRQGQYTQSDQVATSKNSWRLNSDQVASWADEYAEPLGEGVPISKGIKAGEAYSLYQMWSIKNGFKQLNSNNFWDRLSNLKVEKARSKDGWHYNFTVSRSDGVF